MIRDKICLKRTQKLYGLLLCIRSVCNMSQFQNQVSKSCTGLLFRSFSPRFVTNYLQHCNFSFFNLFVFSHICREIKYRRSPYLLNVQCALKMPLSLSDKSIKNRIDDRMHSCLTLEVRPISCHGATLYIKNPDKFLTLQELKRNIETCIVCLLLLHFSYKSFELFFSRCSNLRFLSDAATLYQLMVSIVTV